MMTIEAVVEKDGGVSSQGLLLPDAQIAATSLVRKLLLLTLNFRDFQFINGLELPLIDSLI